LAETVTKKVFVAHISDLMYIVVDINKRLVMQMKDSDEKVAALNYLKQC